MKSRCYHVLLASILECIVQKLHIKPFPSGHDLLVFLFLNKVPMFQGAVHLVHYTRALGNKTKSLIFVIYRSAVLQVMCELQLLFNIRLFHKPFLDLRNSGILQRCSVTFTLKSTRRLCFISFGAPCSSNPMLCSISSSFQ